MRLFVSIRVHSWLKCFALGLLVAAGSEAWAGTVFLQWAKPSAERPWLAEVRLYEGAVGLTGRVVADGSAEFPNGIAVEVGDGADLRVGLSDGYGFVVTAAMLRDEPYVWVKDLGVYVSSRGTWTDTGRERSEVQAKIDRSYSEPYLSCSEKYFRWTGFTEHEPDDIHRKFWDFVAAKRTWPAEARAADRIARMPEVDADYFRARIPDVKFSKTYVGWADHDDQFTIWSHGMIGVSSQSVGGNPEKLPSIPWLPRAEGYTLQFGVGATPAVRYREYGDRDVHQRLEDGYRMAVITEWEEDGIRVEQSTFACPLDGDAVKSGVEPLVAWTRLRLTNGHDREATVYLGLRFRDDDETTYLKPRPLSDFASLHWRGGNFETTTRLAAVSDPELVFEETPSDSRKDFVAPVRLGAGESRTIDVGSLYRLLPATCAVAMRRLGYDRAHGRMVNFWDRMESRGAQIHVPEPLFNNLYRTFLPRIMTSANLDRAGQTILHTSPIVYARVWTHISAYGIAGDLVRRGQFDLARRCLEPFFGWQGIPAPDSPAIRDWDGFFGVSPEQEARVWISFHGRFLWAAGRYFQLSGDRAWLDEKLPALLKGMRWVERNRALGKVLSPDGSRPPGYGWLPAGRAGDSAAGTSFFTDSATWLGVETIAQVLEQIGHPEAPHWRAEADDYRGCLQDGWRRASAERPLERLNDGTWIPYFPAFLETKGIETGLKYYNLVDGAWSKGLFDTEVFPASSPEAWWVLNLFEDSYSELNPSLPDQPFSGSGMGIYLARDLVPNFLYTFYSESLNTMDRETLTTFEHRSWGQKRVFGPSAWSAGEWTRNFTNMLCRTVGSELWLLHATPRRWLQDGEAIDVERLQTEFGPISFTVRSHLASRTIEATIAVPRRRALSAVRLRLRVPESNTLRSVTINGKEWTRFDARSEWIELPGDAPILTIKARY